MTIAELLLSTLETHGVRYIFGNPGTTEIPLVRASESREQLRYIVALSEVSAVPMADGYARATRSLGVVNLHVAPGLGNGMGGLYTAGIAQTPLLVLIGGQDRRLLHTQPILWGPLERMASAVAKAVFSLNTRQDAAFHIRRAVRTALSQPYGPVALICPPDLLEHHVHAAVEPVIPPRLGTLASADARAYARHLASAERPVLIAAEDVYWNHASDSAEALALRLDAPIFAAPYTGVLPVSGLGSHFAGYLPPSRKQIAERLAAYDAVFYLGGRGLRTTLYSEAALSQPKLWIGNDVSVLASEGEFTLAAVADLRLALDDIVRELDALGIRHPARGRHLRPEVPLPDRSDVFHPSHAVASLLEAYADAIWIDESGLSTSDVRQWMRLRAGDYLINGSGGIGWGLAASVGVALGCRDRRVVAIIGDGSALYASEAMWTAAHHGTNLLLVVLSNRRYATLNEAASRLTGSTLDAFTIEPPVLDFSGLARLHGWHYVRVDSQAALDASLRDRDVLPPNTLLDLVLDPATKPVTAARHF